MEKWEKIPPRYGNLNFTSGKEDSASFPLKNILSKAKETGKRQRGERASAEEDEKGEGRTSLGAYILGSNFHTGAIPFAVLSQRKAPSKPDPRVSQSRAKQLSAFAPSLEREKASGQQPDRNVQALQIHRREGGWKRGRVERSRSKRTERRFTYPLRLNGSDRARPFSFLHLCDRVPNAIEHLLNQRMMTDPDLPRVDGGAVSEPFARARGNETQADSICPRVFKNSREICEIPLYVVFSSHQLIYLIVYKNA